MAKTKFDDLFEKLNTSKALSGFSKTEFDSLSTFFNSKKSEDIFNKINTDNFSTIDLTLAEIRDIRSVLIANLKDHPDNLFLINKLIYPMFTNMVKINYQSILDSTKPLSYFQQAMNNLDDPDYLSLCSFFVMNTLMLALTLAQRLSHFVFSNALNYWLSIGWDEFDGLTGLYGVWKLAKNGETFLAMVSTLNNLQLIGTTIFSILFLGIIESPIIELSFSTTMGILGVAFTLSVIIPIAMDYWAVQQCRERIEQIKAGTADENLTDDQKALIELENIQINFHYNNMKAWSVCALSMTVLTVFTFIVLSHFTLGGLPATMLLGIGLAWVGSYLRGVWLNHEKTKDIELRSGHDVYFLNQVPTSYNNYKNSYLVIKNQLHYVDDQGHKAPDYLNIPASLTNKLTNAPSLFNFFKTTHKLHLNPNEVAQIMQNNVKNNHSPTLQPLDRLMLDKNTSSEITDDPDEYFHG